MESQGLVEKILASGELAELNPEEMFQEIIMETGIVALSRTKTVQWLATGDMLVSRRKLKPDGTLEPNAYEVYVDVESCRELIKKNSDILRTMSAVKCNRLPNPTNVALVNNRIVQVSIFNTRPKFGIHKLDEANRITRCAGLNFTPSEFTELMNFFSQYPPSVADNNQLLPGEASFPVTRYSYKWTPNSTLLHDFNTRHTYFVSSDECFQAAEASRPPGCIDVEFSSEQQQYEINNHFIDAALGRLIVQWINDQKTREIMESCDYTDDTCEIMDVAVYGPRIIQRIELLDIYRVCVRAMSLSEKPNPLNLSILMSQVFQRGVNPEVLEALKNDTLHQKYVDLLRQVIA